MRVNNIYFLKELILKMKILSIDEIKKELNCSDSTAKRYLNTLEREGILFRTRGGAILNQNSFFASGAASKISKKKVKNRK